MTVTGVFYSAEYIHDGLHSQWDYNAINKQSKPQVLNGARVNSGKDLNIESMEYYLSGGGLYD